MEESNHDDDHFDCAKTIGPSGTSSPTRVSEPVTPIYGRK